MGGLGKPQPDPNPRRPENTTLAPAVYPIHPQADAGVVKSVRPDASRSQTGRDPPAVGFGPPIARDSSRHFPALLCVRQAEATRSFPLGSGYASPHEKSLIYLEKNRYA
jgi:hypothetical protein